MKHKPYLIKRKAKNLGKKKEHGNKPKKIVFYNM